jgi:glutathione S-transferase/RNA polymerase-associated protein
MLEDVMDTHYEAIIWGLAEIAYFGRASGEQGAAITALAGEQISQWNQWLEGQLGERSWFNGSDFGWGDLAVVPCVVNAANYGFSPQSGTNLARWLEVVLQVPSVAAVMAVASENAFGGENMDFSGVRTALEAGAFKREYRDHRLEWMIKTAGLQIISDGLKKQNIRFTGVFGLPA